MSNEEAELIAKRIFRKIMRMYMKEALLTAKILGLWLLCAFMVFSVAVAFTGYPDTLFWKGLETICLVVADTVMVVATLNEIEQLKRGVHIERKDGRIRSR